MTSNALRVTDQPISAFGSIGSAGSFPVSSGGATFSSALRIADSVMTAGVTIIEERLTGASGGVSTIFGR